MSPLNVKLARDLWRIRGQSIAIASVVAVGVGLLVMMTGLIASLTETRDSYYDRYGLADIYAQVVRAPERLAEQLSSIDGVSRVETRVTGNALIDAPGDTLPVQARAVELPSPDARLNLVYLTAGRLPEPTATNEILLLKGFAEAHGVVPGDQLRATMNGQRWTFVVSGLAQSPEFLYVTAPGEIVPDNERFAVIWIGQDTLSAAYDMEGAFNEALLATTRSTNDAAVIHAVDLLLHPYGSSGAFGLVDLFSNGFLTEEISGLAATASVLPPVFLGVAAFLLNIVVGRIVQSEREEIGLIKAFGYSNADVGWHYLKLSLVIALAGACAGCLLGIASGRALVEVYTAVYNFPFLVFSLDPTAFLTGVLVSIAAATAGGALVLRTVVRLAPAEAMRPPTPPDYSRSGHFGAWLSARLDQPSRMVLRRLTRQPVRALGSIAGISAGMAVCAGMLTIYAGFDRTIQTAFTVSDRSDMTVAFSHPISANVAYDFLAMPRVEHVERVRHVAVVLKNGRHMHRGVLTGLEEKSTLTRALDADGVEIPITGAGVVLSRALAQKLDISVGDAVDAEVREGSQPTLSLSVTRVSDTLLGAPIYMTLHHLNTEMDEPNRVSSVVLSAAEGTHYDLYAELTDAPNVAGVSLKAEAMSAFQELLDTGAGAMRYVMSGIAFIIAFGIVYNTARIAYAERARDLASLRVLGFTRGETAFVLLGELGVIVLIAIPLGSVVGSGLAHLIATGFSTELYRISAQFDPPSHGAAALVVLGAAIVSGFFVRRDLGRADLVAALKTRE